MRIATRLLSVLLCAATLAAAEGPVYVEDDGLVVIEFERVLPAAGWEVKTDKPGYAGEGYGFYSGASTGGGSAIDLPILITTPGRYTMHLRCSNEGAERHDLNNDLWAQMDGGPTYKTFQASEPWKWGARFDHHPEGKPEAYYVLDPGLHTLTLSGRSTGFHVDRVVLFLPHRRDAAHDLATPETRGIPAPPAELGDERLRAAWLAGHLGGVWKRLARQGDDPGATAAMAVLEQAFDQAVGGLPARFDADPLAAFTEASYLAQRWDGAPREDEIADLIKQWKRDERLERELKAQAVIAKIRELETEAERRSGKAQEQYQAQVAQGRQLVERDFADTVVGTRFLGR